MSRLVAFGCSNVYGHGLPDCSIGPNSAPGPLPSKMGWVSTLGKELDLEVINKGQPGASIKEAAYAISNFEFRSDDQVFILIPFYHRWCTIRENDIEQILPSHTDDFSETYYMNYFTKKDSLFMSSVLVEYIIKKLKDSGVTNPYLFVHTNQEITEYKKRGIDIINIPYAQYPEVFGYKLTPDGHTGIEGQQAFAEDVKYYMENKTIPPRRPFQGPVI